MYISTKTFMYRMINFTPSNNFLLTSDYILIVQPHQFVCTPLILTPEPYSVFYPIYLQRSR
ncbi:hypothetical protein SPRA44_350121 [Serratia proteamaculans]|nr:hypothetical protein SPRA44_350121 [Serratia proteamaculans]